METLTLTSSKIADCTCAGCNYCIAPGDPRWISEGQQISNETNFFDDSHCQERMLNREYAAYLGKVKLDSRQEFHCIAVEMRAAI
jgi:hypothetical protein